MGRLQPEAKAALSEKHDTLVSEGTMIESTPKKPKITSIISISDFEKAASTVLSSRSFACQFPSSCC